MLPRISLPAWPGGAVDLHRRWRSGTSLILSSHPGASIQFGGVERLLARLRPWWERQPEFSRLGYDLAFVCVQTLEEQLGWIAGSGLDVTLLSDIALDLAANLQLPTLESAEGRQVYDDLTLVLHGGEVGQVFFPRQPQTDAETVLRDLRRVHG
jgi:hypothetical protein